MRLWYILIVAAPERSQIGMFPRFSKTLLRGSLVMLSRGQVNSKCFRKGSEDLGQDDTHDLFADDSPRENDSNT